MIRERAAGCLVGLAVGDALGASMEFKPRNRGPRVTEMVGGGLWAAGETTDDTDQAALLAECVRSGWDPQAFLLSLLRWLDGARDVGTTTRRVLAQADAARPFEAAERVWVAGGRTAAPNGSLMRTAPVGVFLSDPARCARVAEEASRVTHADPRCVEACRLASELVRQKVWEQPLRLEATHPEVLATARSAHRQEERAYDGEDRGFVLTTLHIALRAFLGARRFEDALVWVINEGGDADTNGAVAGALLGARDGLSAIPERWRSACRSTERMMSLLG